MPSPETVLPNSSLQSHCWSSWSCCPWQWNKKDLKKLGKWPHTLCTKSDELDMCYMCLMLASRVTNFMARKNASQTRDIKCSASCITALCIAALIRIQVSAQAICIILRWQIHESQVSKGPRPTGTTENHCAQEIFVLTANHARPR